MGNEKKTLGEKLRALRESYDLSQKQVAAALNIDRSAYTYYETGKSHPTLESLVKLAHIFKVPPAALLPDSDDSTLTLKDIVRADSLLQTLSKEERGMIAIYRTLDKDDQEKIRDEIAKIAKKRG